MTVLLNHAKLKQLVYSPIAEQAPSMEIGKLLNDSKGRLDAIDNHPGCKCKYGQQRRLVYEDILSKLEDMNAENINVIKEFLNTTTLILGSNGTHI